MIIVEHLKSSKTLPILLFLVQDPEQVLWVQGEHVWLHDPSFCFRFNVGKERKKTEKEQVKVAKYQYQHGIDDDAKVITTPDLTNDERDEIEKPHDIHEQFQIEVRNQTKLDTRRSN